MRPIRPRLLALTVAAATILSLILTYRIISNLQKNQIEDLRKEERHIDHDAETIGSSESQSLGLDPLCGCRKVPLNFESSPSRSTCGVLGDARGPLQRVIAFSFYGGERARGYFYGIKKNLMWIRRFFSQEYIMRV